MIDIIDKIQNNNAILQSVTVKIILLLIFISLFNKSVLLNA